MLYGIDVKPKRSIITPLKKEILKRMRFLLRIKGKNLEPKKVVKKVSKEYIWIYKVSLRPYEVASYSDVSSHKL